jgi:hypothetical protein
VRNNASGEFGGNDKVIDVGLGKTKLEKFV